MQDAKISARTEHDELNQRCRRIARAATATAAAAAGRDALLVALPQDIGPELLLWRLLLRFLRHGHFALLLLTYRSRCRVICESDPKSKMTTTTASTAAAAHHPNGGNAVVAGGGFLGVTPPMSLTEPTDVELQATAELVQTLRAMGVFESEEESRRR